MRPVAVLEQEEVCSKILTHLKLPLHPEELSDGVVVYDVTAEPVFDSDEWMQNAASVSRPALQLGRNRSANAGRIAAGVKRRGQIYGRK